jgi:hypothetical protein
LKQRYRWTRGIMQHCASTRERCSTAQAIRDVDLTPVDVVRGDRLAVMNVFGNLFFSFAALAAGAPGVRAVLVAAVDVAGRAAALHTVAMEEEDLRPCRSRSSIASSSS